MDLTSEMLTRIERLIRLSDSPDFHPTESKESEYMHNVRMKQDLRDAYDRTILSA